MAIKNTQLEDAGKPLSATNISPTTGAGKGAFWTKTVSGVTEAMYTDSAGQQVQLTSNGSPVGGGGGAVASVNGQTGVVVLDKSDIGLGNVDNTSDADKPVSSATQTALNSKLATSLVSQDLMEAGIDNNPVAMSPLRVAQAIAALASGGADTSFYTIKLGAGADLATRIADGFTSLPAGWTAADGAAAAVVGLHSTSSDLVVTHNQEKVAVAVTVLQVRDSGPAATQRYDLVPYYSAAVIKTNISKNAFSLSDLVAQTDASFKIIINVKLISV